MESRLTDHDDTFDPAEIYNAIQVPLGPSDMAVAHASILHKTTIWCYSEVIKAPTRMSGKPLTKMHKGGLTRQHE